MIILLIKIILLEHYTLHISTVVVMNKNERKTLNVIGDRSYPIRDYLSIPGHLFGGSLEF